MNYIIMPWPFWREAEVSGAALRVARLQRDPPTHSYQLSELDTLGGGMEDRGHGCGPRLRGALRFQRLRRSTVADRAPSPPAPPSTF